MNKNIKKLNSIFELIFVSFFAWGLLAIFNELVDNSHIFLVPISVIITFLVLKLLEHRAQSEKSTFDMAVEEFKGNEEVSKTLEKVFQENGGGEKGAKESLNKLYELYFLKKLSKLK